MRAKDYLLQIRVLNAKIDYCQEEVMQLRALAEKTTSTFGGERVQTSDNPNKMEDRILKLMSKEDEVDAEIDRMLAYKEEVKRLVFASCDAECITLLQKRYLGEINRNTEEIEYKTWEEIAVEMGYTYQWVSDKLHKKALDQLQIGLDKRKKVKELIEIDT